MEKSGGVIVAGPQAAINQSKFVNNGIDIKFNRKINTDGTSSGWKCFTKQDCPD